MAEYLQQRAIRTDPALVEAQRIKEKYEKELATATAKAAAKAAAQARKQEEALRRRALSPQQRRQEDAEAKAAKNVLKANKEALKTAARVEAEEAYLAACNLLNQHNA